MPATKIVVGLPCARGNTSYDVRIGSDLISGLGAYCKGIDSLKDATCALVISDSNVAPLYLAQTKTSLTKAGFKVCDIVLPAGEDTKSVEVLAEVWEAAATLGLGRDCFVVALGGGVVGDLAGFVAATFMRGVPVVQVPTTLLAMVDSSVGGKTAVNLQAGKNMVGAFKQPEYVCADIDTLATLPEAEWRCGFGEIAKVAAICSDDFFFWLSSNAPEMLAHDESVVTEAISRCVVFKADVVAQDETETKGVRQCLNYGHTLAHAIEKLAGYGTYSHGVAVGAGMRFAAHLGLRLGLVNKDFAEGQAELLDALDLPSLDWKADADEALGTMKHDKKVRGGVVRFVLARDIGNWVLQDVADEDILEALGAWFEGK